MLKNKNFSSLPTEATTVPTTLPRRLIVRGHTVYSISTKKTPMLVINVTRVSGKILFDPSFNA